jgi:glycosyltransferase involved in cell wall biosynthesis
MVDSILFITNAFPDAASSHRGIFIKRLASLLHEEGYQVSVVVPKIYKESPLFEVQGGVKIYRFPFFAGNKLLIEYEKIPYFKMIVYYLSGTILAIYAFFTNRCRLIHAHWAIPTGLIGALLKSLLSKPLIVTIHGSDFRLGTTGSGLIRRLFLYVCRRADHIHCVSKVHAKALRGLGIAEEKVSTFPMGVDRTFLDVGKGRDQIFGEASVTVFSNRNLQPIYNVSLLIQAIPLIMRAMPGVKFWVAGDGPERERLEKEADRLGAMGHVEFLGRVRPNDMADLLGKVDIYVSTSLYDGTSVSLLEAMASGCFPVVSDIPSNREWIRDGENGFLFPPDNAEVLAQRIIDVIRSRSLIEKSRKENLRLIEERALWSVCMGRAKEIYEDQLYSVSHGTK